MQIFDFSDYKQYLASRLEGENGLGKGARTRLCEAMACKTSYLSQVLRGRAHLSPEQADAANRFLGHGEEESAFFLLLVQLSRAGTESLRIFLRRRIERSLSRRQSLRHRLQVPQKLKLEQQVKYYSGWEMAALHVATTVEALRTPEALAKRLGIETGMVVAGLEFLVSAGLVVKEKKEYRATTQRLHLGDDSDLAAAYHASWRAKASVSASRKRAKDLHYSSVVTVSRKDIPRIREHLTKSLEEAKKLVRESEAEEIQILSLDWFSL